MIYFARPDQSARVKIGFTAGEPAGRMPDLQTGQPTLLRVLGAIAGDRETERRLHAKFAADRLEGEWFRMSPDLAWLIAATDPEYLLLAARDPRAIDLARRIGSETAGCEVRCRIGHWHGHYLEDASGSLDNCVWELAAGLSRRPRDVQAVEDLAYRVLFDLLPECNGMPCGCERGRE